MPKRVSVIILVGLVAVVAAPAICSGQRPGAQAMPKGPWMDKSLAADLGFNVQLGAGVNIAREARNGRNFEYLGEDPILAGTMVVQWIQG
jgi:hypothetical protein